MTKINLPAPEHRDLSWQEHAACRDLTIEEASRIFFPDVGNNSLEGKTFCLGVNSDNVNKFRPECPVRRECLEYALSFEANTLVGIWGGTTLNERKKIQYQRDLFRFEQTHRYQDASLTDKNDVGNVAE